MKEPVNKVLIEGLKCDSPNCDFKDMTIQYKDYKKWINAPCPKCGSNLLTKADYKTTKVLHALVKIANFVCFFIPKKKLGNKVHSKIEMDGSGVPKFGPMEPFIDVNDIINNKK